MLRQQFKSLYTKQETGNVTSKYYIHLLVYRRHQLPRWIVLFAATMFSFLHALIHPSFRWFIGNEFGAGGGWTWYIVTINIIMSWIYFTIILYWLGMFKFLNK